MSHPPSRFPNEPSSYDFIVEGEQSISSSIDHHSIHIKGSLTCTGDLIASESAIKVDGQLHLTGNLTASTIFIVSGKATITGQCTSESMVIKGSIDCPILEADSIQILSNNLSLSKITAQSSIFILYPKFDQLSEPITLTAPDITIRYRAMYSRFMDIPSKLLGVFKKKKKFKKKIILDNLAIFCRNLTIETLRIPDDVQFAFSDPSLIQADTIQVKRIPIRPDRH